jgi:two-component system, OmpR family, response regulator RegX3
VASILLVDDEPGIRDTASFALEREGWKVDAAADAREALSAFTRSHYDVVLLDIGLPDGSGLDVCRAIRASGPTPVLILSARDSESDRIVGLELGADDYVTKPFSLAELVSRVRAILRRRELDRQDPALPLRRIGGLVLDQGRHVVEVDGEPRRLTVSEFRILWLLASRPDHVFTRHDIMRELWQTERIADERSCYVHISNLRRKLDPTGYRQRIVTVRGRGYKLVAM